MPSGPGGQAAVVGVPAAAELEVLVASAGMQAHVVAVAVEVLALGRDAGHRVPELLGDLGAGRQRAVVDAALEDRQQVLGGAPREQVGLAHQAQALRRHAREARGARLQLVDQAAQLGLAEQRPGLLDPGEGGGHRRRRLAHAGQDLAGEGARVREGAVEGVQGALGALQRRPELADRGLQVARLGGRRGQRAVEVRDEALELALVAPQALGRAAQAAEQGRDVVALHAGERVGDERGAAQGFLAVVDGVVEGLGGRLAAGDGVAVTIVGGRRLAHQAVAQALQRVAQALARVLLQRVEDLVELHRASPSG